MIINVLGKFWGNEALINLRDNLPEGFELKLYNLIHQCVKNKDITFCERVANSIVIRYGDRFDTIMLESSIDISYVSERLRVFVKQYAPKTKQPVNIDELRVKVIDNVKNLLNINNDVTFYDDKKMSFELNLYTQLERQRIIGLMFAIDELSPEIFVDINLNNSTVEELGALNDRLIETEALFTTRIL